MIRNRALTTIKVVGLALGTAVFILTSFFCLTELGYDKQHPHYNRIHRYVHQVNSPEGLQSFAFTSATIGPALKERYPEVEGFSRFILSNVVIRNTIADISFNERKFAFVDSNFLEYFHFPLSEESNPSGLLKKTIFCYPDTPFSKKVFWRKKPAWQNSPHQ